MTKYENVWGTIVILLIVAMLGIFIASRVERASCKNGEDVPTGSGAMDCWGSETYKHCEPETRFVCHDQ